MSATASTKSRRTDQQAATDSVLATFRALRDSGENPIKENAARLCIAIAIEANTRAILRAGEINPDAAPDPDFD